MIKNNKNTAIIFVCGIFILLSFICFIHQSGFWQDSFFGKKNGDTVLVSEDGNESQAEAVDDSEEGGGSPSVKNDEIAVFLCGAVKRPGVYKLPAGSRVCDAVKAAGGLKSTASHTAVNQARELSDGEQIEFPTKKQNKKKASEKDGDKKEKTSLGTNASQSDGASVLVNINTADLAELMTLSGIGESRAESIITYREEHGFFKEIKDIMNVTGIKDGIYQKIKDYITV